MTDDLILRLRQKRTQCCHEAADRIEAQAAEVARLRDAMDKIQKMETPLANATVRNMARLARDALDAKP